MRWWRLYLPFQEQRTTQARRSDIKPENMVHERDFCFQFQEPYLLEWESSYRTSRLSTYWSETSLFQNDETTWKRCLIIQGERRKFDSALLKILLFQKTYKIMRKMILVRISVQLETKLEKRETATLQSILRSPGFRLMFWDGDLTIDHFHCLSAWCPKITLTRKILQI